MSDSKKSFEEYANRYDLFGDKWMDMGIDEHFAAGFEAGRKAASAQDEIAAIKKIEAISESRKAFEKWFKNSLFVECSISEKEALFDAW
jgi:hypothetical protein